MEKSIFEQVGDPIIKKAIISCLIYHYLKAF